MTKTTPGSWASPMTSRWRSGSATTTPLASAARSAAARPAAASPFRSSNRSSRRCGPMSPRKPRFRRRHRRPNASSLASQLTSNPGKYRAGGRPSPNVCEWTAKEGLSIPNIASSPAVVPMPSLTGRPAGLPSESGPIVRTISLAPTTVGHANPGVQRHNGIRSGSMNSVGERKGDSPTLTGGAGVRPGLR